MIDVMRFKDGGQFTILLRFGPRGMFFLANRLGSLELAVPLFLFILILRERV